MSRPAASKYHLPAIAKAWRVSERAVRDAAAILGYKPIGEYLYAQREEVAPKSPFCAEAKFIEKSLARYYAR